MCVGDVSDGFTHAGLGGRVKLRGAVHSQWEIAEDPLGLELLACEFARASTEDSREP